jgi:hypothetical protein
MNKTILVIGSVTAKQYEPLRLACLDKIDKPIIKRFDGESFMLSDDEVLETYGTSEEKAWASRHDGLAEQGYNSFYDLHFAQVFAGVQYIVLDTVATEYMKKHLDVFWKSPFEGAYEVVVFDDGSSMLEQFLDGKTTLGPRLQ